MYPENMEKFTGGWPGREMILSASCSACHPVSHVSLRLENSSAFSACPAEAMDAHTTKITTAHLQAPVLWMPLILGGSPVSADKFVVRKSTENLKLERALYVLWTIQDWKKRQLASVCVLTHCRSTLATSLLPAVSSTSSQDPDTWNSAECARPASWPDIASFLERLSRLSVCLSIWEILSSVSKTWFCSYFQFCCAIQRRKVTGTESHV